jgi:DNA-binding transcriptional LysR family regulator
VQGQGLTMLPSFLVTEQIRSGLLIPALTEFLRSDRPINAIYPNRHHLSAKVRAFLDLAARHYRIAHEEFGKSERQTVGDTLLLLRTGAAAS